MIKSRRYLVGLCVAALLFPGLVFARPWSKIKQSGVITVGIEGTYAPFDFMSSQNKPTGFDVDLVRIVAHKLGVKAKFVETHWTALIGGLNADKFDVIAADMTITKQRAKSVDFTKPYNATGAVLVCRKGDAKYHSLADLKGARVGAGAGTTYAALAKSAPGAHVILYNSFPAYLQDLMNRRLDVIINAKSVSGYVIKKHHYPLTICSGVLNKNKLGLIGMAVKKGNGVLLNKLNGAIAQLVGSKQYVQLYKQWFGSSKPPLLAMKN